MLDGKSILVVEREFLVALDLQRILEDAAAGKMVFARSVDEAARLSDRFHEYDLAIVEVPHQSPHAEQLVHTLLTAGVAVAVTSSLPLPRTHVARGLPFIDKPFVDQLVLEACTEALTRRAAPLN